MQKTKEYIEISELIAKEQIGIINQFERNRLEKWKCSAKNIKLYMRILNDLELIPKPKFSDAEVDYELKKLQKLITKSQRSSLKFPRKRLFWLSTAASVILAIGLYPNIFRTSDTISQDFSVQRPTASIDSLPKNQVLLLSGSDCFSLQDSTSLSDLKKLNNQVDVDEAGDLLYQQKLDASIQKWHTLIVPPGATYNVILADGTKVWLNSSTQITYPDHFVGKTREVELIGEAYFEVETDSLCPFIVKNEHANTVVFGTSFNVVAYPDDNKIITTLVEGQVSMQFLKDSLITMMQLEPNLQFEYSRGEYDYTIRKVDASKYCAWKDGYFVFDNETLEDITKKMSRYYNLEIAFADDKIKSLKFTGQMKRFQEPYKILSLFTLGTNIEINETDTQLVLSMKKNH